MKDAREIDVVGLLVELAQPRGLGFNFEELRGFSLKRLCTRDYLRLLLLYSLGIIIHAVHHGTIAVICLMPLEHPPRARSSQIESTGCRTLIESFKHNLSIRPHNRTESIIPCDPSCPMNPHTYCTFA